MFCISGGCLQAPTFSSTAVKPLFFFFQMQNGVFIEIPKIASTPAFVHLTVYIVHRQKSQATLSQNRVLEEFPNESAAMVVEAPHLLTSLMLFLSFLYSN